MRSIDKGGINIKLDAKLINETYLRLVSMLTKTNGVNAVPSYTSTAFNFSSKNRVVNVSGKVSMNSNCTLKISTDFLPNQSDSAIKEVLDMLSKLSVTDTTSVTRFHEDVFRTSEYTLHDIERYLIDVSFLICEVLNHEYEVNDYE